MSLLSSKIRIVLLKRCTILYILLHGRVTCIEDHAWNTGISSITHGLDMYHGCVTCIEDCVMPGIQTYLQPPMVWTCCMAVSDALKAMPRTQAYLQPSV